MKFIKIMDAKNKGKKKQTVMQDFDSTEFGLIEDGAVLVNVEKIWDQAKGKFCYFVKEFNVTCTHEMLHILIEQETGDSTSLVGEEKTVRCMQGEKWNKKLEKEYMEDEENDKLG